MIAGSPTIVTGTLRYARAMVSEVAHPSIGPLSVLGIPGKLSETPRAMRTAPPTPGQHTASVPQHDLGLTAGQIAALRAQHVV
jgi:crotonobetainyl-CoA:carnitine CoA-transferase CaiB-like acyl-CoA transferase